MLANTKKIQKRTERRKAESRDQTGNESESEEELGPAENLEDLIKETDSEGEIEEENKDKQKSRKKKRKLAEPMIEEEGTDIHDMLDPKFVGNLTLKNKKKGNRLDIISTLVAPLTHNIRQWCH